MIPIKPEWLGDEALGKAKKFTSELEKQKSALSYKNLGYNFHNLGIAIDAQNKKAKEWGRSFGDIFAKIGANEKKVKDWNKAFGEVFAQIGGEKKKIWDEFFRRNETGLERMIKKSRELRQDLGTTFEVSTARGIGFSLNKFTGGIDTMIGKVFNLKNALLATAIGGATYGIASRALRGGLGNVRDDRRLRREFGGGDSYGPLRQGESYGNSGIYDQVVSATNDLSASAGIEGGDAIAAFLPIARAIKETKVGSRLKSGTKLKNQRQVDIVQSNTLNIAKQYAGRLLTVLPEVGPEEIGRVLAEAGTGEEGLTSLARMVGLGRASTADVLADSKKHKLPIADIVGKLLERGGVTDQAASDQRKTFDFQIKSIGSQLSDALGNVGTSAIEKLNKSLGEGATLAEKLQKYLSSPEGKKTIDALGESLSKVVSFAADLAKKIPDAIKWISEHKGTLLAIAGVYGAAKIGGGIANAIGSVKSVIGGVRGATPATPLYVSAVGLGGGGLPGGAGGLIGKLGLVAGAGVAGYAIGTAIDQKFGISDKISHISDAKNKAAEDQASATYRQLLADKNALRESKASTLQATTGMNHGQALYAVDHPGWQPPQVNVVVQMDGKTVAHHATTEVRRQQVSQARNEAGQ